MQTGKEGDVPGYPRPNELWSLTFAEANAWRDRFAAVPFEDRGGFYQGRYYQDIAIDRVLEAVAAGKSRVLLTLATGTGKTFIAFQIAWKLFHSRWNLGREPTRRPRILFLADRNILANQAFNAFSAFPEDALVRIEPDDIRKKAACPKTAASFSRSSRPSWSGAPQERTSDYSGDADKLSVIPAKAGTHGLTARRPPWTPASAGATTTYSDSGTKSHGGTPAPISATTRPISSISSSSTNAIAAAPMTRASGATFSITSLRQCSSA